MGMQACVRSLLFGLAAAVLTVPAAEAATIVYSQPTTSPGPSNAWASEDTVDQGAVFRTFDNFSLTDGTEILGVYWQGAYVDLTDMQSPAPDSTAFAFRFYADDAGSPGVELYSQSVLMTDVTRTLVGFGSVGGFPATIYDFSATLPAAFAADAGVTYWLAISSESPTYAPTIWGWWSGLGGDDVTLRSQNGADPISLGRDRAFALQAPEPSILLLLGAGAVALASRRRA
jgi:hypothetical protein